AARGQPAVGVGEPASAVVVAYMPSSACDLACFLPACSAACSLVDPTGRWQTTPYRPGLLRSAVVWLVCPCIAKVLPTTSVFFPSSFSDSPTSFFTESLPLTRKTSSSWSSAPLSVNLIATFPAGTVFGRPWNSYSIPVTSTWVYPHEL